MPSLQERVQGPGRGDALQALLSLVAILPGLVYAAVVDAHALGRHKGGAGAHERVEDALRPCGLEGPPGELLGERGGMPAHRLLVGLVERPDVGVALLAVDYPEPWLGYQVDDLVRLHEAGEVPADPGALVPDDDLADGDVVEDPLPHLPAGVLRPPAVVVEDGPAVVLDQAVHLLEALVLPRLVLVLGHVVPVSLVAVGEVRLGPALSRRMESAGGRSAQIVGRRRDDAVEGPVGHRPHGLQCVPADHLVAVSVVHEDSIDTMYIIIVGRRGWAHLEIPAYLIEMLAYNDITGVSR